MGHRFSRSPMHCVSGGPHLLWRNYVQLLTDPRDPPLCSTQAGFVTLMLPRQVGPLLPVGRRRSLRCPEKAGLRSRTALRGGVVVSVAASDLLNGGRQEERCQYGMEVGR
jgi:hypothetical protein